MCFRLFFSYINQNGSIISKIETRKKKKKKTLFYNEKILSGTSSFKNSNILLVLNSREYIFIREVALAKPVKISSNMMTLQMPTNLGEVLDIEFNAGFH